MKSVDLYYKPGTFTAIDLVKYDESGKPVRYDVIRQEYGDDVVILPSNEVRRRINESAMLPPMEIDQEEFDEAYECLPPYRVSRTTEAFSFLMSEFYVADITTIYCRLWSRYWKLRNLHTLSHQDIVALCTEAWNKQTQLTILSDNFDIFRPVVITRSEFESALSRVEREKIQRSRLSQSFSLPMPCAGHELKLVYCQMGNGFWKFQINDPLSHSEISERCGREAMRLHRKEIKQ
jgi:hypothetical protein